MISVSEARKLIQNHTPVGKISEMPLLDAAGFVLAEPAVSGMDMPPFHQSAMDGYAFRFEDLKGEGKLRIIGEVQAGGHSTTALNPGEAFRIFTGASVPEGADTVVMQEKVTLENGRILIQDEGLRQGSNVRLRASQTRKGETALEAGQTLTPAALSFLAGLGITRVRVYSRPIVRVIVTGKELIKPGNELSAGEIYESNSFGIIAGLQQLGIVPTSINVVDDQEALIVEAIAQNLQTDLLIITGGVSVGDYDFVTSALDQCGVQKVFHKVKQKPGKPFYFGKRENTLVFGLPGNPASVMTCFYQYVVPAVSQLSGRKYYRETALPLAADLTKKPGLTHFLKGRTHENGVEILSHQESYLMDSFARANCLVELEEEREFYKKGEPVIVLMIA